MAAASAIFVVLTAPPASAQTDTQVWANATLEWIKNQALTFNVDIEPKVLVSKPADHPGWATLDVTPSVEYTHGNRLDAIGELHLSRTRQSDRQSSSEIAPRVRLRFHLLSNIRDDLVKATEAPARHSQSDAARMEEPVLLGRYAAILDAPRPGSH